MHEKKNINDPIDVFNKQSGLLKDLLNKKLPDSKLPECNLSRITDMIKAGEFPADNIPILIKELISSKIHILTGIVKNIIIKKMGSITDPNALNSKTISKNLEVLRDLEDYTNNTNQDLTSKYEELLLDIYYGLHYCKIPNEFELIDVVNLYNNIINIAILFYNKMKADLPDSFDLL